MGGAGCADMKGPGQEGEEGEAWPHAIGKEGLRTKVWGGAARGSPGEGWDDTEG